MKRTELLNNVDHGDLRVAVAHGARFGDAVNLMPIVPTEFDAAQRDHPILFRQDDRGAMQAVVLLGLDRDENLHLFGNGWRDVYVPAIQRRGPFLIGVEERRTDGEVRREPMIRINRNDPRVGDPAGEPLFLSQGGNAPYLEAVSETLRILHVGAQMAPAMFAALEAAGLIRPVALEIALDDVTKYDLPNFSTIDVERLQALDGAALERLNAQGFLALAFAAASSLGNIPRLIAAKNASRA